MAMSARLSALLRLGSYGATTGFIAVIGLVAAAVFISAAGSYSWGVLASIQSAAALFGVLVGFGWGTTGAAEVASMPSELRPSAYADSLVARVYLIAVAYPLMVVVMGLLNPTHFDLVLVGSLAYLVPYLGASWYFVGESRPSRLFLVDVMPQGLGVLTSIGVMAASKSLVAAVTAQLLFNTLAVCLGWIVIRSSASDRPRLRWSVRSTVRLLAQQRHPVTTAATSALYVSAPMLILNAVAPASLAQYAMGDRLFRVALTVFSPVLQFVQGWIPEGGTANLSHRVKQALRFAPAVGLAGAICIALLGPLAVSLLSQGIIGFGFDLSIPFGAVFLVVSVTQILGLACLVPLGKTVALATSTVFGAVLGVPLLVASTSLYGVHGAVWALLASELVVLIYQARAVIAELRRRQPPQPTTS